VLDTVNRSSRAFTFVLGRLSEGKTIVELRAYARALRGELQPPVWFTPEATGETPPRSSMTWVVPVAPGSKALACVTQGPPAAWVPAALAVGLPSRS